MNTKTILILLPFLVLNFAAGVGAQSQILQLRASAEFRDSTGQPEVARQLALDAARQKVLQDAVVQLQSIAEIKAIPFKPNQMDAFLPAIVEVEARSMQADNRTDRTSYTASVELRMVLPEIVRSLGKLRKDPDAVAGLMEVWRQNEALHRQLAQDSARAMSPQAVELLARHLRANRLLAYVYGALAKTEEGSASVRVISAKGHQRAMQLAELAVMTEPGLPEAHLALGDALMDLGHNAAAEEEYRQSVLLDPNSSRAHLRLSDALRREEKIPEAVSEVREALRIDPKSAGAHNDLAFLLESPQNIAESISEYREAVRLDPDLIEAHNYLAIALARQGHLPEAVAEFREIVRIDPDSALGYYNMASALADMNEDAEAAEALRQAVRINPHHINAHYNLGEMFRLDDKFDEAVKQFREYLRLAPDTPQNQRNIRRAKDFVQTYENP